MARDGAAAGTIALHVGVLRQILGSLVHDGQLEQNVASKLGRIGPKPKKAHFPDHAQVRRLIDAARPQARPVFELAASTGLRRGELFTLRWRDVDFETRQIRVVDSKTKAGERIVPMFASARKVLLEQKARSRFKRPHDLVFCTSLGTPFSANSWMMSEFYSAMKHAGMEKAFRFHDLRHYAVSCLIQQGAHILLVSRVAGHAHPSITLDVYAHLFNEDLVQAATRFDPLRDAATAAAECDT